MIRILGIDPGSRYTGYGIVDCDRGRQQLVACGRIKAGEGEMGARLVTIDAELRALLLEYQPVEAAFEQVFVQHNVRSALVLGQARGVALCAAARAGLTIAEYAPTQIKSALTGSGRAEKDQVQHMVKLLLKVQGKMAADAADALAVALTHAQVRNTRQRTGLALVGSWKRA